MLLLFVFILALPHSFTLASADSFSVELKAYVETYRQDDPVKKMIIEQKIKDSIFDSRFRDAYEIRLKNIDALAEAAEKSGDPSAVLAYMELARTLQLRWLLNFSDSYFSFEKFKETEQKISLEIITGIALTAALLKAQPQKIPALLAWVRRLQATRIATGMGTTLLASDQSHVNAVLKVPKSPAELLRFGYRDLREESGTRSLALMSEDERLILLEFAVATGGCVASALVVKELFRNVNIALSGAKLNVGILVLSIAVGLAVDEAIPRIAHAVDEEQLRQNFLVALRAWKEQIRQGKRWARWKASRELSDSTLALYRFWIHKELNSFQQFHKFSQEDEKKPEDFKFFFSSFKREIGKKIADIPPGVFSYLNQKQALDFLLALPPQSWEMSLSRSVPSDVLAMQPALLAGWKHWKLNSQGNETSSNNSCLDPKFQETEPKQQQSFTRALKTRAVRKFIKNCDTRCSFSEGISPLVFVASLFESEGEPNEVAESEKLWIVALQWREWKKLLQ